VSSGSNEENMKENPFFSPPAIQYVAYLSGLGNPPEGEVSLNPWVSKKDWAHVRHGADLLQREKCGGLTPALSHLRQGGALRKNPKSKLKRYSIVEKKTGLEWGEEIGRNKTDAKRQFVKGSGVSARRFDAIELGPYEFVMPPLGLHMKNPKSKAAIGRAKYLQKTGRYVDSQGLMYRPSETDQKGSRLKQGRTVEGVPVAYIGQWSLADVKHPTPAFFSAMQRGIEEAASYIDWFNNPSNCGAPGLPHCPGWSAATNPRAMSPEEKRAKGMGYTKGGAWYRPTEGDPRKAGSGRWYDKSDLGYEGDPLKPYTGGGVWYDGTWHPGGGYEANPDAMTPEEKRAKGMGYTKGGAWYRPTRGAPRKAGSGRWYDKSDLGYEGDPLKPYTGGGVWYGGKWHPGGGYEANPCGYAHNPRKKPKRTGQVDGVPLYVPQTKSGKPSQAKYHRATMIRNGEKFPRGYRVKVLSAKKGIKATVGLMNVKGARGGQTKIQGYLFDARKYTPKDVVEWVKYYEGKKPLAILKSPLQATERRLVVRPPKASRQRAAKPKAGKKVRVVAAATRAPAKRKKKASKKKPAAKTAAKKGQVWVGIHGTRGVVVGKVEAVKGGLAKIKGVWTNPFRRGA